jgi:hypothetical protein
MIPPGLVMVLLPAIVIAVGWGVWVIVETFREPPA